ncbi:MAG: hypothetical protein ACM3QS_04480 [Bacteroidota bacterium]
MKYLRLILVMFAFTLIILLWVVFGRARRVPALPSPQLSQHQVYIAQIKDLDFQFFAQPGLLRKLGTGDFVDFVPGAVLRTGKATGYVFIGLPGRAELFMAPESEIQLVSSDSTGVVIQLNAGRAILSLPADFPSGRSFTVLSAAGARTWISGSGMCLSYQSSRGLLRMDCLEDRCFYEGPKERAIPAGYHVIFTGKAVTEVGPGLQPEECGFVPGMVPLPTATVIASPTVGAATPTP